MRFTPIRFEETIFTHPFIIEYFTQVTRTGIWQNNDDQVVGAAGLNDRGFQQPGNRRTG